MPNSNRTKNFTETEKEVLLSLINKHKSIIESKKTDTKIAYEKSIVWNKLCSEFNARSKYFYRDVKHLQIVWKNMKARRKVDDVIARSETFQINPDGEKDMATNQEQLLQNSNADRVNVNEIPTTSEANRVLDKYLHAQADGDVISDDKEYIHFMPGHATCLKHKEYVIERQNGKITQENVNAAKIELLQLQIQQLKEEHNVKIKNMKEEHNLRITILREKLLKLLRNSENITDTIDQRFLTFSDCSTPIIRPEQSSTP